MRTATTYSVHEQKMATQKAKEVYASSQAIVEPVFGHHKNSEFRSFSLRDKEKVAGEFSSGCAAYNFKKIVRMKLTAFLLSR